MPPKLTQATQNQHFANRVQDLATNSGISQYSGDSSGQISTFSPHQISTFSLVTKYEKRPVAQAFPLSKNLSVSVICPSSAWLASSVYQR